GVRQVGVEQLAEGVAEHQQRALASALGVDSYAVRADIFALGELEPGGRGVRLAVRRGGIEHLEEVAAVRLRRAEGAGKVRPLPPEGGEHGVRRQGRAARVPVRVVREVELLSFRAEER